MLETGIITLMTLEKNVDNFINVIKGKGQNPCGLRNLTGGGAGWAGGKEFKLFYLFSQSYCIFLGITRR